MHIVTSEELKNMMAQRLQVLNPPADDGFIWRYYPLEKFLRDGLHKPPGHVLGAGLIA